MAASEASSSLDLDRAAQRPRFTVVSVGEALFDVFPGNRHRLGGAPLNVAVHAHQLAAAGSGNGARAGGRSVLVSRVGQDDPGRELIEQLRERGLDTGFIQEDPDRPTGRVYVGEGEGSAEDEDVEPGYEIVSRVAWDMLWFDPELEDLAQDAAAVCFGSLAQREAQTRHTIHRMLTHCRWAVRLFDVNLRQSGGEKFYDARTLRRSCEAASVVKCNSHELAEMAGLIGVDPTPHEFIKVFGLNLFVLTRGEQGTRLITGSGQVVDGAPASNKPEADADPVGAGDACSAAVMVGLVERLPTQRIADLANQAGAFVASRAGATPPLPEQILQGFEVQ